MKILNLIIKQIYFDEIIIGKKKIEYREIRAKNAHMYIEYVDDKGNVYKKDTNIPDDVETDVRPIKYDAIQFYVGYNKNRDSALVEVEDAEIVLLTDENDNEIVYEYEGREYVAAEIEYYLGKVIEKKISKK